jgi:hypothetical protein
MRRGGERVEDKVDRVECGEELGRGPMHGEDDERNRMQQRSRDEVEEQRKDSACTMRY